MNDKIIKGRAWTIGDNIDTDAVIHARYLSITDPKELGKHCLEELNEGFPEKISQGDILVAGQNFGCGSSREHAPVALKASGLSCIIAQSFSRLFFRNAINIGLPVIEVSEIQNIKDGDHLQIDTLNGRILDIDTQEEFKAAPLPEFMQNLLKSGGLISYIEKRLEEKTYEKKEM